MVVCRYPCPCCGFLTLTERPPGTYDICPVCDWEDDDVQYRDPEYRGGANEVCLREARTNFAACGAKDLAHRSHCRPPQPDELPGDFPDDLPR